MDPAALEARVSSRTAAVVPVHLFGHPADLEPILAVDISVPTEYTSRVLQLISQKRGQILGYDAKDGWRGWDQIAVHIPQAEIHDLIVTLRSLTQGVGFFGSRFDHLSPVPDRLAETVVAQAAALLFTRQHDAFA